VLASRRRWEFQTSRNKGNKQALFCRDDTVMDRQMSSARTGERRGGAREEAACLGFFHCFVV
jgi:hypothetical protein